MTAYLKCFLIVALLFLFGRTDAQTIFKRTYGFGLITEGRSVLQTFDHGYAVCGSTTPSSGGQTNFYLLKTDSLGVPEYQYAYGGIGIDLAFAMVQMPDSGFLLAGYSNSYSANSDYDACVVRTDKSGNMVWTKTFGTNNWDFIYDMQQTTDGNFILIGNTYGSGNGTSAGYVVKIDSAGNVIWQKFIQQNSLVNLKQVAIRNDGTFIVCGNVSPSSSYPADYFLAFLDVNGDTIKTKTIDDGKHESFNAIDFTSNGDIVLAGASIDSVNNNNVDEIMMRLDAVTNIAIWSFVTTKPGTDDYNDLFISNDTIFAAGSNTTGGAGNSDFKIHRYDQNGTYIDGTTFGAAQNEFCYHLQRTNDSGLILVGTTTSFGPGQTSVFLIKTDSLYNQAPLIVSTDEIIPAIDVNVFPNPASGSISIFTKSDFRNLKLFTSTGELILENRSIKFPVTFNIENLQAGFYILELLGESSVLRKKILIQK